MMYMLRYRNSIDRTMFVSWKFCMQSARRGHTILSVSACRSSAPFMPTHTDVITARQSAIEPHELAMNRWHDCFAGKLAEVHNFKALSIKTVLFFGLYLRCFTELCKICWSPCGKV